MKAACVMGGLLLFGTLVAGCTGAQDEASAPSRDGEGASGGANEGGAAGNSGVGGDVDGGGVDWSDPGGTDTEDEPEQGWVPEPLATCETETPCLNTVAKKQIDERCTVLPPLDEVNLYLSPTGDDGPSDSPNDCLDASAPCLTLERARDLTKTWQSAPSADGTLGHHVTVNVCNGAKRYWHQWVDWTALKPTMRVTLRGVDCDGSGKQPVFDGCKSGGKECNLHFAFIATSPKRANVTLENVTFQRYQNPIKLGRFVDFKVNEPVPDAEGCNTIRCNTFRHNGTRWTKTPSLDGIQGQHEHNFTTGLVDMVDARYNVLVGNRFVDNDINVSDSTSRGHTHSVYLKFGSSYNCFFRNSIVNSTSNFHLRHSCHHNAFVENDIRGSGHRAIVDEWNHPPGNPPPYGLPECSSCQNVVRKNSILGTFGCSKPQTVYNSMADLHSPSKRCTEACPNYSGSDSAKWLLSSNELATPKVDQCGYLYRVGDGGY